MVGDWLGNGTSHNPSVQFMVPFKINCRFLRTNKCSFVKIAIHPSLHNVPAESNGELVKPGRIFALFGVVSLLDKFKLPLFEIFKVVLSGWYTNGPLNFVMSDM